MKQVKVKVPMYEYLVNLADLETNSIKTATITTSDVFRTENTAISHFNAKFLQQGEKKHVFGIISKAKTEHVYSMSIDNFIRYAEYEGIYKNTDSVVETEE